ncbi:cystatin-like protein [Triplophysa dalaica]|uniref:cystatin-like protein n=1 Tax=Triplophysa dalaica TaxID=1582913 RepID=UPI0024DF3A9F|nr:cystatin-like protein [Triplophysa dalaica]
MRGLLWVLSAVLLLGSTDGGKNYGDRMIYEEQHENIRGILDKAIKKANEDYGRKHIDFFSIYSEDYSKQMVHVLLTSTTCDKTIIGHRKDCEVLKLNKPSVSCVACRDEINCALLRETGKINNNIYKCKAGASSYHTGAGHVLFQKEDNEQEYGCLGCV